SYERMNQSVSGKNLRFLRIVPNTPLMVGYGATAFATPCSLHDDEMTFAKDLFSALGTVDEIDENLMHAVTSLSGSGPAYVYMFIEALADAGVQQGLPRDTALALAIQTIEGGAQMVRGTGKHPASLRDEVCSPGGTTIDAVAMLEKHGFRSSIFEAVQACAEKAKIL
ncbi:MAG: pyrroline-5-carboxylate reductase family protein, partial [Christensenellaceae bacterium]